MDLQYEDYICYCYDKTDYKRISKYLMYRPNKNTVVAETQDGVVVEYEADWVRKATVSEIIEDFDKKIQIYTKAITSMEDRIATLTKSNNRVTKLLETHTSQLAELKVQNDSQTVMYELLVSTQGKSAYQCKKMKAELNKLQDEIRKLVKTNYTHRQTISSNHRDIEKNIKTIDEYKEAVKKLETQKELIKTKVE